MELHGARENSMKVPSVRFAGLLSTRKEPRAEFGHCEANCGDLHVRPEP